jgi:hypothetical protein
MIVKPGSHSHFGGPIDLPGSEETYLLTKALYVLIASAS